MFIYISAGELFVNGQRLRQEDQARLDLERTLHVETTSASPAEFVLIDIPANIGSIIKQRKRGN